MIKSLKDSIGEIKGVSAVVNEIILSEGITLQEITNDRLLLTSKNKLTPKSGDNIEIVLYCTNGVFTFSSIVTNVENNFPYYFWHINIPQDFIACQGREFYRTRFNIKTTLSILFHNGEKKLIESNSFDISGNGASLILSPSLINNGICELLEKPDINKYAKLGLCLHFPERNINTRVQYVHKRALSENSKITIYAFQFTNLAPADCDFITKQCFSRQLLEQNKSKN